jgi:hypothetical protein
MHYSKLLSALVVGVGISSSALAAIVPGFDQNELGPNDDASTGRVNIGFTVNFFGNSYAYLYVNNNGNVTFDDIQSTFTPYGLTATDRAIIAPFFADVDTRYAGSPVTYGTGTFDGKNAFGVNWIDVDYYDYNDPSHTALNSFQLLLVERADIGTGDFDIYFNYGSIQWETGTASGGNPYGLGGYSARAGWSNGQGESFELPGSAVNGAFLDRGPNSLSAAGGYIFSVHNGSVAPPTPVPGIPEPETYAMLLAGLGLMGLATKRRRKST